MALADVPSDVHLQLVQQLPLVQPAAVNAKYYPVEVMYSILQYRDWSKLPKGKRFQGFPDKVLHQQFPILAAYDTYNKGKEQWLNPQLAVAQATKAVPTKKSAVSVIVCCVAVISQVCIAVNRQNESH
jgi:hypothetical protein